MSAPSSPGSCLPRPRRARQARGHPSEPGFGFSKRTVRYVKRALRSGVTTLPVIPMPRSRSRSKVALPRHLVVLDVLVVLAFRDLGFDGLYVEGRAVRRRSRARELLSCHLGIAPQLAWRDGEDTSGDHRSPPGHGDSLPRAALDVHRSVGKPRLPVTVEVAPDVRRIEAEPIADANRRGARRWRGCARSASIATPRVARPSRLIVRRWFVATQGDAHAHESKTASRLARSFGDGLCGKRS